MRRSATVWLWFKGAFSGIVWKFVRKYTNQMGLIAVKYGENDTKIDFVSLQRYGAVYLKKE